MEPLDDPGFVLRNDPKGMYALTVDFPGQCRRALEIAQAAPLPAGRPRPDSVVLTGLGGSAAGGDFAKVLMDAQGAVPFQVNRDYSLPSWVGPGTLVVAASYSGNTEETLAAYADAKRKGAPIVVVTSGGTLAEAAQADGFPLIRIPGGQPPRTALGYLCMPVVHTMERFGLLPAQDYGSLLALLESCVAKWAIEAPVPANAAKRLAQRLHGRLAVLYGLGAWQGAVASRWKGQINENAKAMTFFHTYPELCHNEVLGWVKADAQGVASWVTVVLEDGSESAKMRKRAEVVERLTGNVSETLRAQAQGETLLEKAMSLTLLGDFVSLYMAALNDVDPENIDSINVLKAELALVE
jgi:glucose/mannose-6-phosphate isomerase